MKIRLLFFFIAFSLFCNAQNVTIPDLNFKAKLLGASATNTIAKDLSGNYFKIDSNSDGQIQVSEALQVSELILRLPLNGQNLYISSIEGITDFSNLTKLDVSSNKIDVISISGMQYLTSIDCSSNSQYLDTLELQNLPSLTSLICNYAGSNTSTPVYTFSNLPNLISIRFGGCRFYDNTLDNITSLEEMYGYAGYDGPSTNLDLSNKPNLRIVELGNNDFSNITFMPNNIIETLLLSGSSLTTFDKSLFSNLQKLDLSWNELNTLDVSGMTSLLELNCDNASTSFTYDFVSLNVQGCTNLNKLICSRNSLTSLNLSNLSNLVFLDCYGNTNIFDETGLESISLMNCSSLKKIDVSGNDYLTELDLSCSSHYTEIRVEDCENLQRINLKNGAIETIPISVFSFDFCPNLDLVCVDFGENFSYLPDNIQQTPYYDFAPNCFYNTVKGTIKFDIEGDGCQNNEGVGGIKIQYNCDSPECFTFSDSMGNFTIYTQSNSITLTPVNDVYPLFDFGLTEPITLNFNSSILENVALCLAPEGIHNDLEVAIVALEIARPGFDSQYKLAYKNKGNQTQSGTLILSFEGDLMDLVSANPLVSNTTENSLQWDFQNMLPFEEREILLTFNINSPTETPAVNSGTILHYTASLTSSGNDETPENNTAILNETVVNSYDPNNKICMEGTSVLPSIAGKYVHYTINFENNGTANAQNIVVRDIIDTTKFDIATLEPISSSHNVYTRITNANLVEFIFENISLPFDDAHNDGYIMFKIKTKPTLVLGDTFSNTASIYFDYNYPIITNTFTSTLANNLSTDQFSESPFFIYPNPVNDVLFFKSANAISKVEIFDTTGRILKTSTISENKLNVSDLKTGNYILKIFTEKEVVNTKIIKK